MSLGPAETLFLMISRVSARAGGSQAGLGDIVNLLNYTHVEVNSDAVNIDLNFLSLFCFGCTVN